MFHVEHHGLAVARDVSKYAASIGINLSSEQLDLVSLYVEELENWGQKINLTAISDPLELAVKHFIDSLYGATHLILDKESNLLDIGTGAGFPGIPLKIAHPDIDLYLIEKNRKKVSFLSHLIGKLKLKRCHVLAKPASEVVRDNSLTGKFMNVVVRAVGFNQVALAASELMHPLGRALIYSTERGVIHETKSQLTVSESISYDLPRGYGQRTLLILEKNTHLRSQSCSTWNIKAGARAI